MEMSSSPVLEYKQKLMSLHLKKGMKKDPENYRLVSLISVPGKVMELLILETSSRNIRGLMSASILLL